MPNEPTTNESADFRQRLFDAQQMNPSLYDAYRKELDSILHETHTPKSRIPAITLLVICLGVVAGEIRALMVYPGGPMFYTGAITMLLVCGVAAGWIVRDLMRGQSVRKESFKMADMFYAGASILTVAALMHGLAKPHDSASIFNAFYVFVFLTVCANWSFSNRFNAVELSVREQNLRLECRLADLAEKLGKNAEVNQPPGR